MDNAIIASIKHKTYEARKKVLEMCVNAGAGHLTSAYSCAEIVAVLYHAIMNVDPQNPGWEDRDRLIISKNHGSVMQYPFLADLGFFPENELMTFMQDGSRIGGHSKKTFPGIDFSGGSLGIGLGIGAGIAYSAKTSGKKWYTFVIVGDGECYEGSIWEAAMFAGHNQLKNLVVILDRNGMCCTDFTANLLNQEPFAAKWQSFGWDTFEVNGHDIGELIGVLENVRERGSARPLCIIANTIKGGGIDFISNKPLMHGIAPKGEDITKAFEALERGCPK